MSSAEFYSLGMNHEIQPILTGKRAQGHGYWERGQMRPSWRLSTISFHVPSQILIIDIIKLNYNYFKK